MRSVFFLQSAAFYSRWLWLKIGFYIVYFLFIQIANSTELSFWGIFVNTLIWLVMVGIIEISQYCLHLSFPNRRYINAILILGGNYITLAVIGYYILHESENFVATKIWNQEIDASWYTFLSNYNKFYWAFFKYGIILSLIKQIMDLFGTKAVLSDRLYTPDCTDVGVENSVSPLLEKTDEPKEFPNSYGILPVKVGTVTHMLDVFKIVYLEVQDEITTVYQIDGFHLEVKISLSKFYKELPKDRFVRIHDSRVIALPYLVSEKQGHVYMRGYEDRALKLGKHERFPEYKKWKENNRLN